MTGDGRSFTRAIVRPPAASFAEGITTAGLGSPDLALALAQHAAYCAALTELGLTVKCLAPDAAFPDSTFVEDTAVVTQRGAIVTRPGAASRAGEVPAMRRALAAKLPVLSAIETPGTVDGGDVCQAGEHFFIGLSQRTNQAGAEQLALWLQSLGFTATTVDIRATSGLLHLKSGIAWLGERQLVVAEALAGHAAFRAYERVVVRAQESYAANCVRVNDAVLVPAGYPELARKIAVLGHTLVALEMSEFRKMDGGLSCLSLRW
jgi:dimethylargininase